MNKYLPLAPHDYPKSAPPIWAYEPALYARVVIVRTFIGTLLMGTPAQLAAMRIDLGSVVEVWR